MADILKGRFGGEAGPKDPSQSSEPNNEKPKNNLTEGSFGQPPKKEQSKLPTAKAKLHTSEIETNPDTVRALQLALEAAAKGDPVGKEIGKLLLSTEKAKKIEEHILGLKGLRPSKDTLAAAEQYWMSKSTEELLKEIDSSNSLEWSTSTATYMALVDEHVNRLRRLLEKFRK